MDVIVVLCLEPTGPEVDEDWLNAEAMAEKKRDTSSDTKKEFENVNLCFSTF
jgi:hypothetical protein